MRFLRNDPDKLARIAGAEDRAKFKAEMPLMSYGPLNLANDEVQIMHSRLHAEWNEAVAKSRNREGGRKSKCSFPRQERKVAA